MSQATVLPIQCDGCEEHPVLKRKQNRTLVVSCACKTRSVKIRKALPSEW